MKKRAQNRPSPRFRMEHSDSGGDFEAMMNDLVEIIISGLSTIPTESTGDVLPLEKTLLKRDSFPAGLPFGKSVV